VIKIYFYGTGVPIDYAGEVPSGRAGFVWINGLYQALLKDVRNRLFGEIKGKMV